jgi:hypothetical protein
MAEAWETPFASSTAGEYDCAAALDQFMPPDAGIAALARWGNGPMRHRGRMDGPISLTRAHADRCGSGGVRASLFHARRPRRS